jgi:hypothetical protein
VQEPADRIAPRNTQVVIQNENPRPFDFAQGRLCVSKNRRDKVGHLSLLAGSTRQIYAWDTTGKNWPLPRRRLRELQREAQTWMRQQMEHKAR